MICFYVQLYFCFRLYIISGRIWIVGPIALLFLFAFVAVAVAVSVVPKIAR
jgi:protein-S-isoprenylcysteine O-methyltransferase Ste14